MALVAGAFWEATITFLDKDKNEKRLSFRYPAALLASAVITELTGTLIPALVGVSDAGIVGYAIDFGAVEKDATTLANIPETSDVERKLLVGMVTSYDTPSRIEIPSVRNALIVDGSNIANTADPAIQALLAAIVPTVPGASTPVDASGGAMTWNGRALRKVHRDNPNG